MEDDILQSEAADADLAAEDTDDTLLFKATTDKAEAGGENIK